MRAVALPALVAGFMMLTAGCGDDGPTEGEITGMWYATCVEYANRAGTDVVELISDGCTATLNLKDDHSFIYTFTGLEGEPSTMAASWELTGDVGDVMRVTRPGTASPMYFDVEFTGSTLKLMNGGSQYDFDQDGIMEDADWSLTLMREAPPSPYPSLFPIGPAGL